MSSEHLRKIDEIRHIIHESLVENGGNMLQIEYLSALLIEASVLVPNELRNLPFRILVTSVIDSLQEDT